MKIFLISITVISSILMIIVILLQQGKGAELGAAFGRGAQGGLFSASGKANFMTRTTSTLVAVFLLSSLALSIFVNENREDRVLEELQQSDTSRAVEALDENLVIDGDTLEISGDDIESSAATETLEVTGEETEETEKPTDTAPAVTEESPQN